MNGEVHGYVLKHRAKLKGKVLEVGSYDVNGNIRDIVPHAIGTDMRAGPNVDIVCPAEKLQEMFAEEFDAVISLDALEHMEDWRGAVRGMWAVLKPDGWLLLSMAGPRKRRHDYPNDYWRATWDQVRSMFPEVHDPQGFGVSMAWLARKIGPLPDLEKIVLMPPKS